MRHTKLITARFIGELITRDRYHLVRTQYGLLGSRFGHLGAFSAQLIVHGVTGVLRLTPQGRPHRR